VFKSITGFVIGLNFVVIVWNSDYKASHVGESELPVVHAIQSAFTLFYVLELVLRLLVDREDFFLGDDLGWNMFDILIVLSALIEIFITALGGLAVMDTSFLRIMRFLKISRILRMFSAVTVFKEVEIMVDTIAGCATIVMSSALVLILYLSVFAIFFLQGSVSYLEDHPDLDPAAVEAVLAVFGGFSTACVSLFAAVTGGRDWGGCHSVVKKFGPFHDWLFVCFIAIYYLAFINIITAAFCEKALRIARPNTTERTHQRREEEWHNACELKNLVNEILSSGDETVQSLCETQLRELMRHEDVKAYFSLRGLHPISVQRFFKTYTLIFDTHVVDLDTFVSICVKLGGASSSLDVYGTSLHDLHRHSMTSTTNDTKQDDIFKDAPGSRDQCRI